MAEAKFREVPMTPLLIMLLQTVQEEAKKKVSDVVSTAVKEYKIPDGSQADLTRYVWIVPEPKE